MESRGLANNEIDAVERRADLRAIAVCYSERSEARRERSREWSGLGSRDIDGKVGG
jgi:hypothetical protein